MNNILILHNKKDHYVDYKAYADFSASDDHFVRIIFRFPKRQSDTASSPTLDQEYYLFGKVIERFFLGNQTVDFDFLHIHPFRITDPLSDQIMTKVDLGDLTLTSNRKFTYDARVFIDNAAIFDRQYHPTRVEITLPMEDYRFYQRCRNQMIFDMSDINQQLTHLQ